ncbi:SAM-dependent methyltransferase, partial [Candidatus Falkowbacteria bacterium]|nr:SAM-dependent methyltransferase [Candidatus Falkowbacteria bacterium]
MNRERKWNIFLKELDPSYNDSILDVGYSDKEYSKTDNYLEKHYPYKKKITALGVEELVEFPKRYPK